MISKYKFDIEYTMIEYDSHYQSIKETQSKAIVYSEDLTSALLKIMSVIELKERTTKYEVSMKLKSVSYEEVIAQPRNIRRK